MKLLPAPTATALRATSPTGAEGLRECPLRFTFDRSSENRRLAIRGPATRLGSVAHAVLEDTSNGHFDLLPADRVREELEALWQCYIEQEQASMGPLEQHFGPAHRWPYYSLKRALTFRMALSLIEARQGQLVDIGVATRPLVQAERRYEGFSGAVKGRADHVIEVGGRVEIEDYKTGAIRDAAPEGEDRGQIKPAYRRQLLLYAALHWDETGVWPALARLISLDGESATIEVDPQEAQAIADETVGLLSWYNRQAEAGVAAESLARPSEVACLYCSYKGHCRPYWESVSADWDLKGRVYLAGKVISVQDYGQYGRVVEVDAAQGNIDPGRYRLRRLMTSRFPNLDEVSPGTYIRAVSLWVESPQQPLDLVPTDYTELWWCRS